MKKQANFFLIILVIYVFLQFIWWGNLLIRLNGQIDLSQQEYSRRVWMIIGEGSVFRERIDYPWREVTKGKIWRLRLPLEGIWGFRIRF